MTRPGRIAAGYAIVVGLAMAIMWTGFYLAGEIPELSTAPLEIGYHLVAEGLTALALLASGVGVLGGRRWAGRLLPVALGMLGYTVINSAGYYAELGDLAMVGMFTVLTIVTGASILFHLRGFPSDGEPTDRADGVRL